MKIKLPFYFVFFVFQLATAQEEKLIKAKMVSENFPLKGVEVLNLASKKTTITDANGEFSILAKAKDTLMFVSKNYEYKKIVLKKEDLRNNNLCFSLTRKPEQLEEVEVFSIKKLPHIGFNQEYADKSNLEKAAKNPKPIGVHNGSLLNSPDLMRIAGMILKIFVKEKEIRKNKLPETNFKELATTTLSEEYYLETIHLKPEEKALFLELCNANPKSKMILENANPLK